MVGIYDSIESFYASDDPYRFEYDDFGYQDYGFGSEPSSFMSLGDTALGYDPYVAEQQGALGNISVYDREYMQPSEGMINAAAYDRSDPFSAGGDYYGQGEVEFEDDRTIFKMLQEYLGLDEILSEKDMKFLKAFAKAAGFTDKQGRITGDGLGRTSYKAKSKTPAMKQGAAMSKARQTANRLAGLSRTAPNGNEYLRRQDFDNFKNAVGDIADLGTTGSGLRGTTIKEAGLKDIKARQYVSKLS